MKRAVLALALSIAACVPASEARPPAGAAGFDTDPSEATRDGHYTTRDGWAVEIERFVLQLSVAATPSSESYGRSERWLFDGRQPAVIYSRALPLGQARVSFDLYGRYLSYSSKGSYSDEVDTVNIDAETAARFEQTADNELPNGNDVYSYQRGPSLWITLRAEKERVITLDLALNVLLNGRFDDLTSGVPVEVPENDVGKVKLGILAENLFPELDEIALADEEGDGDGNVTVQEMQNRRLLDQLETRLSFVFVPR